MKPLSRAIAAIAVVFVCLVPLAASAAPGELSAGTMVTSKMNTTIDSGSAHVGDTFSMTVVSPYPSNNAVYANAQLYGHVTQVVAAGQGKNPVLAFNIDRIVLKDGRHAAVSMTVQSQQTQRHNNIGNVAITAVGGMIIGNMIGKTLFKSNLGGAAGLIAGALYANNKRTNVSLRAGSIVVTELRQTAVLE
jgi:uncharacterized protein YcfJ